VDNADYIQLGHKGGIMWTIKLGQKLGQCDMVGRVGTVLSYKHKQGGTRWDILCDKSWDEIGECLFIVTKE